ncbi:hypothetical protein BC830DRAFT_1090309 [Chytriomyces sp. MP71]|nr:hypothetical protein BC830DRAFT_1090309 [Chytriomyces sp. MP71]
MLSVYAFVLFLTPSKVWRNNVLQATKLYSEKMVFIQPTCKKQPAERSFFKNPSIWSHRQSSMEPSRCFFLNIKQPPQKHVFLVLFSTRHISIFLSFGMNALDCFFGPEKAHINPSHNQREGTNQALKQMPNDEFLSSARLPCPEYLEFECCAFKQGTVFVDVLLRLRLLKRLLIFSTQEIASIASFLNKCHHSSAQTSKLIT